MQKQNSITMIRKLIFVSFLQLYNFSIKSKNSFFNTVVYYQSGNLRTILLSTVETFKAYPSGSDIPKSRLRQRIYALKTIPAPFMLFVAVFIWGVSYIWACSVIFIISQNIKNEKEDPLCNQPAFWLNVH